jgi:hypothetical protein
VDIVLRGRIGALVVVTLVGSLVGLQNDAIASIRIASSTLVDSGHSGADCECRSINTPFA